MLLIEVQDHYDHEDLRQKWVALEQQSRPNFFLTWRWIGNWIATAATAPLLVVCRRDGNILALGLLQRHIRRRGPLTARQLCLHETGDVILDGSMIEHNGFLLAPGEAGLGTAILRQLQYELDDWDELVLSGISQATLAAAKSAGLIPLIDREYPTFIASLDGDGSWLASRSKGLRSQLRQSQAYAEQRGTVRLVAASDVSESLDFFEHMVVLHTNYWRGKNKAGAFASDHSRNFHRRMIATPEAGGKLWLLRLQAGDQVLGYLYNFQAYDRVYAYQSAFAYSSHNQDRPGLLAHALAIKQATERGAKYYDFLAGNSPYKARLGQKSGTLVWARAQRKYRPLLALERAAEAIKRGIS